MRKFSNDDFYGHRNMDEAIDAADQGNSAARDLIARTVLSQYKAENPFDPRMPDHRKMEDLMNKFKEEYKDNERQTQSQTPSYSINSTGVKRERSISPTRESLNSVKNEHIENDRKKKIREAYEYYSAPVKNAFLWAITPKKKVNPGDSLTPGNSYRKDNTRMHARKRGGSKKTRKSKKSSRRNRK